MIKNLQILQLKFLRFCSWVLSVKPVQEVWSPLNSNFKP